MNIPTLAPYDPDLPTIVYTNASDYSLVSLFPDRAERAMAFVSRTLTPVESKHSTVDKEALGCVWAVEK